MRGGAYYTAAMEVTTQEEADKMFESLVKICMKQRPCNRGDAEAIQRQNLGYFAGYYSNEVRARVEKLYRCAHPIFGAIAVKGPPTAKQAFEAGRRLGKAARKKKS